MSNEILLKVDKLSVAFGGNVALSDVSLTLNRHAFLVILGPSGCGKSTLLNALCGVLKGDEHTHIAGSLQLGRGAPRMAYAFQSASLLPWFTVEKNVAVGARLRGASQERARNIARTLLEKVGLDAVRKNYPGQLSGGMRQRVALARVLANDAEIILMDEPLGALDAFTRMAMQDLISKLWHDMKKTVVMVTHDLQEALVLGTEVILMDPHPGRVRCRIENADWPVPRRSLEMRSQAKFAQRSKMLWATLQEQGEMPSSATQAIS